VRDVGEPFQGSLELAPSDLPRLVIEPTLPFVHVRHHP
jgi:hypothetical protein